MENRRPVWTEINLQALQRNYDRIQALTESEIMPIVKADAYGHGALQAVEAFYERGARRFGVALLNEALELRRAYPDIKVMLIGSLPEESIETVVKEDIICGVYQLDQAVILAKEAERQGKKAVIHLKVDTGMGRIGFREEDWEELFGCTKLPGLYIEGIYTHFATADHSDLRFAREQLRKFLVMCDKIKAQGIHIPIRHAANSGALLQLPEAHLDMVRPGIILYGLPPSQHVGNDLGLEPVLSWKAKISHIKVVPQGETISYGRTFRTAYPTRVATIPLGYADGLRRNLSNKGEVLIKGRRTTMIGRVCMDQTMLDVTKIPEVQVGDVVTLLGMDGYERIDATEMAGWLDTINYEIVCGISKRVPRVYIK
ncbi:alanine racemase [Desulfitobacterium hafniense]|uniref:Alanine racemase n=5 Tax=root TaxID=1 RepID=Q24Q81_DESHY|nr:alanine racemase [Desulfitobacterium hafniense]ACL19398.1 alanine racemase [Desulfitobacterium hafniense DCB-2]EHL03965.1 alanine racemase [Desulfitobacterium hafniense DP7]KTE90883.1 alanine racemase [Desulfitobacterium hafniense]MEA5025143.1 alanine racemase [Desulfitobacterium hafniense]CDX04243.1 Alanine racemase [Desulfitobacterium hafniense]